MRAICCVCLLLPVLPVLCGCQRSPYEEQVFEHAKAQAELNAINFERAHSSPPRAPLPSLQCAAIEQNGVQTMAC